MTVFEYEACEKCSSLISLVANMMTKCKLKEKTIYLASKLKSTIERSQDRCSNSNLEAVTETMLQSNNACWLASCGLFNLLFQKSSFTCLQMDGATHSVLDPPTPIFNQENIPTDFSQRIILRRRLLTRSPLFPDGPDFWQDIIKSLINGIL